jgi:hypothetical protein
MSPLKIRPEEADMGEEIHIANHRAGRKLFV